MASTGCLYCDKGDRLAAAMIPIRDLDVSTLYLFREQSHPGRCVVAFAQGHIAELFELDAVDRNIYVADVARVARAVSTAVGAAKINYGAYGDKTPHLHFHIVPKQEGASDWGGTFEMMPRDPVFLNDEGYAEIIAKVERELDSR